MGKLTTKTIIKELREENKKLKEELNNKTNIFYGTISFIENKNQNILKETLANLLNEDNII